jgi:hypothetical protein
MEMHKLIVMQEYHHVTIATHCYTTHNHHNTVILPLNVIDMLCSVLEELHALLTAVVLWLVVHVSGCRGSVYSHRRANRTFVSSYHRRICCKNRVKEGEIKGLWSIRHIPKYFHLRFVRSTVVFLHPKQSFATCLCL